MLALIALWAVIYMAGLSHPRLARRCRHGACRGGEGNAAAARLGDAVRQRRPLSGKSSADVLGRGHQLHAVRHQRVEHAPSARARRAGDDSLHLRFGPLGFGRRGRIRFRAGAGDRARTVSFYALSDSRRGRRPLADPDLLAFSGIAGAREACALDLLGTRRRVRAQRADQGTDRTGVSGRSDRALSAADGKSAALAQAAPGFERAGVSSRSPRPGTFWRRCEIRRRATCADFSGSTSSTSTFCVS